MAAPIAAARQLTPEDAPRLADVAVRYGGCFARQLPPDVTCAGVARRYFREAVAGLDLPADLVHDGVTMASELAANTLHADRKQDPASTGQLKVGSPAEFWLYLRGWNASLELVCKIFDGQGRWDPGDRPGMGKAPAESVSGRGLQLVAGLSAGQWGSHPSRSRLSPWKVPGKAVWFALRIPPSARAVWSRSPDVRPERVFGELAEMLAERGLIRVVRAEQTSAGLSVLSISRHLSVWRHGQTISWRESDGQYRRMPVHDLIDITEEIVSAHEVASFGGDLA